MRQRNEDKTAEFKKENEVLSKELKKAREEEKLKGKEVISLKKLIETMGDDGDDEAEEDKEPETVKSDEPKAEEVKKPETVKPVDSKAAEVKKPEDDEPVDLTSNFNNDNVGSATANEESTVKPPAVVEKEVAPKPTKEASKAVELPDETIEVVTSEEEWEGTTYYKIGHHLVKDVRFDKDSLAIGAKLPFKIVKESRCFTATSLNNKITFIATNTQAKSSHNPEKGSSVCGLTPVCTKRWVKDEKIASVLIFDSNWHPKNEKEQWVCGHHHEASIRGNNPQIQKLCKAAS